jgi:non-ribosomal peptide synthase protein (TIGR01720 family)
LIHGRDLAEVDVTASVGCYVNYSSTIIEVDVEEQPSQILQSTHEQLSVQVDIGNRVDLVRFLGSDDELSKQLDELPKADVLLNYVGKTEDVFANSSLFEVTNDSRGGHHDPDGQRDYALAILAEVVEDQFQARFVFSRNLQRQESVARLAERFVESVAELLEQPSVLRSVGS